MTVTVLVAVGVCVCSVGGQPDMKQADRNALDIRRPRPDRAYIHVYDRPGPAARPQFSMLLPEFIRTDAGDVVPVDKRPVRSYLHMQPTRWEDLGAGRWRMTQTHAGYVTYEVTLTPTPDAVYLDWRVRNDTQQVWKHLTGNFCTGAGWCPFTGPGAWYNPTFQPAPPPPKATDPAQAQRETYKAMVRCWTHELLRRQVSVHTPGGWRTYPDAVKDMDVGLVARRSLDGTTVLAQAWNVPAPASHGPHLCVHLSPMIAAELAPGAWASARGATYLLKGTLDELLARYRRDVVRQAASPAD